MGIAQCGAIVNPRNKKGHRSDLSCGEDKAPVDHEGLKGYLLVARPEKNEESLPYCPRVSTTDNQRHNVTIYVTSLFFSLLAAAFMQWCFSADQLNTTQSQIGPTPVR